MFSPKNILVPTDFSMQSERALDAAIDIAKTYMSRLYVVHVVDRVIQQCGVDYCLDAATLEQIYDDSVKGARDSLKKQVEKANFSKDMEISYEVLSGSPYDRILKYQKEKNIDLIVISPHGKTGLMAHIMGSVADRIVHSACCQVLLLMD